MSLAFDPADPVTRADPYPALARLREHQPVHWSPGLKCWLLTRYDDVKCALASDDMSPNRLDPFYASLPDGPRSTLAAAMHYFRLWLVFRDPPEHTRLRRLVTMAFLPGTINGFRPVIEDITQRLLSTLAEQTEADLVAQLTMQLPALVIMRMLGVPDERLYDIKHWSDDIMLFIGSAKATPDKYERARHGALAMADCFRALIANRRQAPGDDLLGQLITARDAHDRLSEDELVATAMLLLFAGHETTTNLLSNATLALMHHADQRALLAAHAELASSAVEECLRFDGPIISMARVVRRTHEVAGIQLSQGERVFAVIAAANRDTTEFRNPDQLDLTRTPNRHLAFGQGIHFCLGAQLARLEARIALPMLWRRFPDLAPAGEPRWLDALVMRGLGNLPVRLGAPR